MSEEFVVICAFDRRVLFAAAAMLHSVRQHLAEDKKLRVFCFVTEVPAADTKAFSDFFSKQQRNCEVSFLTEKDLCRGLPEEDQCCFDDLMKERISAWKAVISRLYIPLCLPSEIKRVVHLDVDVIAINDISGLSELPLDGYPLAGVVAPLKSLQHRLPHVKTYFNAGVLVIDLERWRSLSVSQRSAEWLSRHPEARFRDQDALNAVLTDEKGVRGWKMLEPTWQALPPLFLLPKWFRLYDAPPVEEIRLVHFAGPAKPWLYDVHPLAHVFWPHLESVPFKIPHEVLSSYRWTRQFRMRFLRLLAKIIG